MPGTMPLPSVPPSDSHLQQITQNATFEIIPLKSAAEAIEALPPNSKVSVTASPTKGLDATLQLVEQLVGLGHHAIPHFSARLVRDRAQAQELASWTRDTGVTTAFVIGGDVTEPAGYHDALTFLGDLLEADHGLNTVGVAAYPDGHPLISEDVRRTALFNKQQLLADAGVNGYCSTQMCFDPGRVVSWLETERSNGLTLPVHLGIAGAVERSTLLTVGARLGVGQSLRYLRKNRHSVTKLLASSHHNPGELLEAIGSQMAPLGISGLHMFTFNQVASTAVWQQTILGY